MKKIKYLHCVLDDKFIDGAISLFDSIETAINEYVFVQPRFSYKKELKGVRNKKVRIITEEDFRNLYPSFDIVVLHALSSLSPNLISCIAPTIKVIWLAWGYDIYNKNVVPLNLFYPETKNFVTKDFSLKSKLVSFLLSLRSSGHVSEAIERVDYFSGVFPYEHDLVKNHIEGFKAKPLDFYYGSTTFFVPEKVNNEVTNTFQNMIIGNSNTPSNNHVDAFQYLKCFDVPLGGRVIIPLSYPTLGSGNYKKFVTQKASEIWGDKLMVLDKYLPLQDYLNIVSNCKVAVYFHERQQASDNIFMQLLYGAKVYLSSSSLAYQYLKQKGFYIFSLQDHYQSINEPLSIDQIIHNRQLLTENYSSSRLIERVKIIDTVMRQSPVR